MKSRLAAIGGRHRIALLVLSLVTAALVAGGGPTTADAAEPQPISTPMTGILPPCPAQVKDFASHDVWVEDDINSNFSSHAEAGLDQNCAWQNMQDRTDTNLWPRAVNARAVPATVSINDDPTTINFVADGLAAPGPFNTAIPDCMPLSTRPGGCSTEPNGNPGIYVAYRTANGAGQFVGRWTQVIEPSDNPYFDLERDLNGCQDRYPGWTPNYPHTGLPCEFELNFATNVSGAPVLTRATQVIVAIDWLYGTKTVGSNTGYEYGYEAVVPLLFTPGTSSSISLDPLPSPVSYGTQVTLRAAVVGPPAGTPVTFYRRGGNGVAAVVGQALTDGAGAATLGTAATGNAEFWAELGSGVGSKQSQVQAQSVTRGVALAVQKKGKKKVTFTATLTPGSGSGSVLLQRKDKKNGWVAVKTGTPAATVAWTLKPPKGKSWWRVLLPTGADFLESDSAEVKVKRRR